MSPVRRKASSTSARRSAGASPTCSNGKSTFASTVHQGSSAKSWNTKVSGLRLPAGGAPRSSAAPEAGRSRPPRIDNSVLLPQPDGPTIATTSPAATSNETSSSTSSAPKRWLIWSAIRSIQAIPAVSAAMASKSAAWLVDAAMPRSFRRWMRRDQHPRRSRSDFRVRCVASPRNWQCTNQHQSAFT